MARAPLEPIRMLPFTPEQFFAVFADYNAAVWPMQAVAYAIGLVMAAALLRPSRASDLMLGAGLALMWAWTGVLYHGLFFSSINRAALFFEGQLILTEEPDRTWWQRLQLDLVGPLVSEHAPQRGPL